MALGRALGFVILLASHLTSYRAELLSNSGGTIGRPVQIKMGLHMLFNMLLGGGSSLGSLAWTPTVLPAVALKA